MRTGLAFVLGTIFLAAHSGGAFAQDVSQGQKVYIAQKCSMCHSIAGKGNPKGALDDVGSRLSEDDIREWVTNPRAMEQKVKATRKPAMPAYTKLSAEDLKALVSYLASLKKK